MQRPREFAQVGVVPYHHDGFVFRVCYQAGGGNRAKTGTGAQAIVKMDFFLRTPISFAYQ
jgi:hypothetical protein